MSFNSPLNRACLRNSFNVMPNLCLVIMTYNGYNVNVNIFLSFSISDLPSKFLQESQLSPGIAGSVLEDVRPK